MADFSNAWTLLVYKIPSHPSRFRVQIWRKLQSMGALYLQDAVCALPSRPDLDENMQYIAAQIEEMGGNCYLFSASALLPGSAERLVAEFRAEADSPLEEIAQRLDTIQAKLETAASLSDLEQAEAELKRERIAYLRARRLAFFGSARDTALSARLEALKESLDDLCRSQK